MSLLHKLEIDFVTGAMAHRRKYGGGKSQLIAKAVGVKTGLFPSVLDLTAGLGRDAFVLAGLGCQVTLVERNPDVFMALSDAYGRALDLAPERDPSLLQILKRMHLVHQNAFDYLASLEVLTHQVVYLDPMFPERKKSAAVKKEMVILQQLVGADEDAFELFDAALKRTPHRIVVKRPRHAPALSAWDPPLVFEGESSRFDVYPYKKLSAEFRS